MNYLSVCSGIEAASVAWHPHGWKPVAFAEIEKFPSAVLAHHYPDVPNLGDMTKYDSWKLGSIDLLVGGTPCQAFSVAGLKRGLADARGNLALTFCEIADHYDPEWVVWENVPGVLNDRSNAFGCFLGRLCGASDAIVPGGGRWASAGVVSGPARTVAWCIRDAQYFGVAQQRRRVFVLAVRGPRNWRCAAALFPVCDGVRRDPAEGRKARKSVAGSLTKSLGRRCGVPDGPDTAGQLIPFGGMSGDVANCLTRREGKGPDSDATTTLVFDATGPKIGVRRLTPRECERLQGFPDDYTAIPKAADGSRYAALGNSMAVPVMRWIAERIEFVKANF